MASRASSSEGPGGVIFVVGANFLPACGRTIFAQLRSVGGCHASQKALDCLLKVFDRMAVTILHRMDQAVGDVLVNDHLAETPNGGIDCGQLNEDVRAVLIIFDHILYFLKMADDSGQPVQHLFLVLRGVVVPVDMSEVLVFLQMFMRMVCHFLLLLGKN